MHLGFVRMIMKPWNAQLGLVGSRARTKFEKF